MRHFSTLAVFVVMLFSSTSVVHALPFDWLDAGTNWGTGANWDGGSTPGSADPANFPSDATITNQPDVNSGTFNGATGPNSISVNNSGAAYNINDTGGNGVLSIGSGGLTVTGGGSTTIAPLIQMEASQTWDIGSGSTVTLTDRFHQGNAANTSFTFTKTGEGTLTFAGAADNVGVSPQRPLFDTQQGTTNVQWNGLANGTRPTIRASGTGLVNINSPANVSFHFLHAGEDGEVVINTSPSAERLRTGEGGVGGTITVGNGAAVTSTFGTNEMRGGTMRTLGTGTLTMGNLQVNASDETATIQGNVSLSQVWHQNAAVGAAAIQLDIQADLFGTNGLIINDGFNLFQPATFRLSGNSSYTGVTTLGGGTLLLGNHAPISANGALGSAASTVELGFSSRGSDIAVLTDGAFVIARNFDIDETQAADDLTLGGQTADVSTFSGNLTVTNYAAANLRLTAASGGTVNFDGSLMNGASNGVRKVGDGTVNLNGVNTYAGTTNVDAGTLGGNGSITSNLNLNAGTTLSPGTSVGTLTVDGNVVFDSTATYHVELNSTAADNVNLLNNSLTLNGATLELDFLAAPALGEYIIFQDYSTLTGTFANFDDETMYSVMQGAVTIEYFLDYQGGTGNDITLTVTNVLVPEPSSFLLLGSGLLLMTNKRRRQSQKSAA